MEVGRPISLFLQLSYSTNRSLDSMVESGLILKAYKDLAHVADAGNSPDIFTYNVLINGFCKAGNIDDALKLLSVLQRKGLSQIASPTTLSSTDYLEWEEKKKLLNCLTRKMTLDTVLQFTYGS